jgi:hypothetical protein
MTRAVPIAIVSILTATGLAIQLSPRPPNVEFTSLIVFVTGMVFGSIIGSLLGTLIMFVNGFLSPYGFGGLFIPFQMAGMVITGFSGGLYGRLSKSLGNPYNEAKKAVGLHIEAAVMGAFLTTIYQILMIAATALVFTTSFFVAFISSILFMVSQIVSNIIIFGITVFPISYAIKKFLES